jgi:hypothetical protein
MLSTLLFYQIEIAFGKWKKITIYRCMSHLMLRNRGVPFTYLFSGAFYVRYQWQLKTLTLQHGCLILAVPLLQASLNMSQSLTIETAVVKVPGSTQRDKINPLREFYSSKLVAWDSKCLIHKWNKGAFIIKTFTVVYYSTAKSVRHCQSRPH